MLTGSEIPLDSTALVGGPFSYLLKKTKGEGGRHHTTIEAIDIGSSIRHHVFENINFSVAPGEIFCLLGPNGCGKLRCWTGFGAFQTTGR